MKRYYDHELNHGPLIQKKWKRDLDRARCSELWGDWFCMAMAAIIIIEIVGLVLR